MVFSLIAGMLLGSGMGAGMGFFSGPLNVASNSTFPVNPLGSAQLDSARFRGIISRAEYEAQMRESGISPERAQIGFESATALNDTQELITLYFRGALGADSGANESEYYRLAGALGLSQEVAERAAKAALQIGTPTDLVRFLVREVFTPALREQLQLDAEYPENADGEFRRLGISPEYARNIWAAHWQLPALGQLQTTFHRYSPENRSFWEQEVNDMGLNPADVETTTQDMSDLLKFADVGIYYRPKLLSTLYSDLGQIQLRWLVRFGFLDFAETTYRLQRRGLPLSLARTVAQVFMCVQKITDWKDGIKAGILSFDDVLSEMGQWEITNENVKRIVQLKVAPDTLSAVEPERNIAKSTILDAYDLGAADAEATRQRLIELGYSRDQASFILDVHEREQQVKEAKVAARSGLTRAEIKKAYRTGAIDADEAARELERRGMEPAAIQTLLAMEAPR